MTATSESLPVAEVKPGMLVGEDLLTPSGQVLVSQGTVLTPKLCEVLKDRGIEAVVVTVARPRMTLEEVQARLEAQFRHTTPSETMTALRTMFERYHSGGER